MAEVAHNPAQQARDLHLRDAQLVSDLLLGTPVDEAHPQDAAITQPQATDGRLQDHPSLSSLLRVVVVVDQGVAEYGEPVATRGSVQRGRSEAAINE